MENKTSKNNYGYVTMCIAILLSAYLLYTLFAVNFNSSINTLLNIVTIYIYIRKNVIIYLLIIIIMYGISYLCIQIIINFHKDLLVIKIKSILNLSRIFNCDVSITFVIGILIHKILHK